jgi:hypothetical protein
VETQHIGAFLAPIAAFLLFGVFGFWLKMLVAHYMPDGWLKRAILKDCFPSGLSEQSRRVREHAERIDAAARDGR